MTRQSDKQKKPLKRARARPERSDPPHEKLYRYLEGLSHASYEQKEFDELLDAAKEEVQKRNYLHDKQTGFLADEAKRFAIAFRTLPLFFSFIAAGITALTTFFITYSGNEFSDYHHIAASIASIIIFTSLSIGATKLYWVMAFDANTRGNRAVQSIRQFNRHVLMVKFKALHGQVITKAKNDEPESGATGILQLNLLFISGYVLQKTIHRCHTRFARYLEEVAIPSVAETRRIWFAALAAAAAVAGLQLSQGSGSSAALVVLLSMLAGSTVFFVSSSVVLRRGGSLQKRRSLLRDAYEPRVSRSLLDACDLEPGQEDQLGLPDLYEWNGSKGYAEWLYKVLKRYDDLQNRQLPKADYLAS